MQEMSIWHYLIIAIFLLLAFRTSILDVWRRRLVEKTIAMDRICRLADIGLKDLRFEIVDAYRAQRSGLGGNRMVTTLSVQFHFRFPKSRAWGGNGIIRIGDAIYVEPYQDSSGIEDTIAANILKIKEHYEHAEPPVAAATF